MTTDKDITKKADEHKLQNWVGYHAHLFQWGPTKNAVILRDMAIAYDAIADSKMGTSHKSAVTLLSQSFAKVRNMLNLVELGFKAQASERKVYVDGGWKTIQNINGFQEHLVYMAIRDEIAMLNNYLPEDMLKLFRAVCKETINTHKEELKLVPPRAERYSTQEVVYWTQKDYVKAAKAKWKAKIGKKIKNGDLLY